MLNKERISFRVVSAQPEKLLNALKEQGISCTGIRYSRFQLTGTISRRYKKALESICKKLGLEPELSENGGLFCKIVRYKKRYGILVGCLMCLLLCFFMSNYVFYIEVTGNTTISTEKILYSLKENGIVPGKFIPHLDFLSAERTIAQQYDQIAWISIRSSGGRIIADIDEADPPPKILPENIPCNIVAGCDAQITKVRVLNGLLIPLVGDGVKKGDILISGTMENLHGETRTVRAIGSVTGIYQKKQIFRQPFAVSENVPNGEQIIKRKFTLLSFSFPLDFKEKPIENFDFTRVFQPVSLFSIKFPFGITTDRYAPYQIKETLYTPEQAEEELLQQIAKFEEEFLKDAKILNKEIEKEESSEAAVMTVLYTLEGEIGRNEEIILQN